MNVPATSSLSQFRMFRLWQKPLLVLVLTHCALSLSHAGGQVYSWGDNSAGQSQVPPGLTNAQAVAGGYRHSLALRPDGTVVAWGFNNFGQTNVPPSATNI